LKRIVVAEDSRTQAERLRQVLSRDGWDVEIARDGRLALDACRRAPPDAVITDVVMPELDGFGLCRALATDPATRDVPVIVLTSLREPADVVRALAAGAANFVAKPYEDDELIARLNRTVARRSAPDFPIPVLGVTLEEAPREGRVLEVLASALDDARRRTEEVERARRELQEKEAENRRLYEDAVKANRAKDEFLAVMSHEVRTPLNAISGWAALLLDGKLDASHSRRAIETIARSARAQARLIDDILDVSRIVAGKIVVEKRVVDASTLFSSVVSSFEPAASARQIQLLHAIEPGVTLMGDADRLAQVLSNLVGNAIKFSPVGGRVTISLLTEGSRAELRVDDEGEGIEPDLLPHVFERFRQGDTSTSRRHGGLGLGLAIVRHLVELHGGTASATSAGKGRGASFVVALPCVEERSITGTRARLSNDSKAGDLSGLRILAVEDDPDSAELLEMILERTGADAKVVRAASDALDVLPRFSPHVLVSDIGLPGEDGHALVRRVRTDPAHSRLPAVALTAFAGRQSELDAKAAGFDAHLAKPAAVSALVAAVKRAIAAKAQ